jgi:hypothetical protein
MQALAITANGTAARLGWWEIVGGIVLPTLFAIAQGLLLQADTAGPWLTWGYTAFGIAALLARSGGSLRRSFTSAMGHERRCERP